MTRKKENHHNVRISPAPGDPQPDRKFFCCFLPICRITFPAGRLLPRDLTGGALKHMTYGLMFAPIRGIYHPVRWISGCLISLMGLTHCEQTGKSTECDFLIFIIPNHCRWRVRKWLSLHRFVKVVLFAQAPARSFQRIFPKLSHESNARFCCTLRCLPLMLFRLKKVMLASTGKIQSKTVYTCPSVFPLWLYTFRDRYEVTFDVSGPYRCSSTINEPTHIFAIPSTQSGERQHGD